MMIIQFVTLEGRFKFTCNIVPRKNEYVRIQSKKFRVQDVTYVMSTSENSLQHVVVDLEECTTA